VTTTTTQYLDRDGGRISYDDNGVDGPLVTAAPGMGDTRHSDDESPAMPREHPDAPNDLEGSPEDGIRPRVTLVEGEAGLRVCPFGTAAVYVLDRPRAAGIGDRHKLQGCKKHNQNQSTDGNDPRQDGYLHTSPFVTRPGTVWKVTAREGR
jgi:hypothetical protein